MKVKEYYADQVSAYQGEAMGRFKTKEQRAAAFLKKQEARRMQAELLRNLPTMPDLKPPADGCRTKPHYPFNDDELAKLATLYGHAKKQYLRILKNKYDRAVA